MTEEQARWFLRGAMTIAYPSVNGDEMKFAQLMLPVVMSLHERIGKEETMRLLVEERDALKEFAKNMATTQ